MKMSTQSAEDSRNGNNQNGFGNQQRRKAETPTASSTPKYRGGNPGSAPDHGKPQNGRRKNKGPLTVQKLCKYHVQFGDKARTCKRGCNMFASTPSNGKAWMPRPAKMVFYSIEKSEGNKWLVDPAPFSPSFRPPNPNAVSAKTAPNFAPLTVQRLNVTERSVKLY